MGRGEEDRRSRTRVGRGESQMERRQTEEVQAGNSDGRKTDRGKTDGRKLDGGKRDGGRSVRRT